MGLNFNFTHNTFETWTLVVYYFCEPLHSHLKEREKKCAVGFL